MEDFATHPPQSRLHFLIQALGFSSLLMLAAFVVALVLIVVFTLRGRGPAIAGGVIVAALLPLLLGIARGAGNGIGMFGVISVSDAQLRASELASGVSSMLVPVWVGGWLSIFLAVATMVCVTVRVLRSDAVSDPADEVRK